MLIVELEIVSKLSKLYRMLQIENVNFLRCVDFVNSFVEDRLATLRNVIKDPALDQWNLYLGTPLPTCHV